MTEHRTTTPATSTDGRERHEGPRFHVRTWREATPGCAAPLMWYARIVPVRPEAAPFTDARDERQAVSTCPDVPRLTMASAVEAAIEKWARIWGDVGPAGETPGRRGSP